MTKGYNINIVEALVLLVGAVASLFFLITLEINNVTAWILFGSLVLAPYLAGAARCYSLRSTPSRKPSNLLAIFSATAFGLYLMVDAIYLHPDAQGGLAVLMVPVIQVPIYLAVYAVASVLKKS